MKTTLLRSGSILALRAGAPIIDNGHDPLTEFTVTGLSELTATGSMTAGSYDLVLDSNPGFAVDDEIIVSVGGEAAASAGWGFEGVGGVWPLISYPDATTREADTSLPSNTYVYDLDTGDVYLWSPSWAPGEWKTPTVPNYHYFSKAQPRALAAKVLAVDGTTLTLDLPALVSTTDTTIYFNNFTRLNDVFQACGDNVKCNIPAGDYAVHGKLETWRPYNRWYCGAGKDVTTLFSPRGSPCFMWDAEYPTSCKWSDMTLDSNFGSTSWVGGLAPQPRGYYKTDIPYKQVSLFMGVPQTCSVEDLKVHNYVQSAIQCYFGQYTWARRCDVVQDEVFYNYTQWGYEWNDSLGGGYEDCTFLCEAGRCPSMEGFRCSGISMLNCTLDNGMISLNSCGGHFLVDGVEIISRANNDPPENYVYGQALIELAVNVTPPAADILLGGTIQNVTMTVLGYENTTTNDLPKGININTPNENVTVLNTVYDATGLGYLSPSSKHGAQGIVSTAPGTLVDGLTVIGGARAPYAYDANIFVSAGTVQNSTADYIDTATDGGGNTGSVHIYTG